MASLVVGDVVEVALKSPAIKVLGIVQNTTKVNETVGVSLGSGLTPETVEIPLAAVRQLSGGAVLGFLKEADEATPSEECKPKPPVLVAHSIENASGPVNPLRVMCRLIYAVVMWRSVWSTLGVLLFGSLSWVTVDVSPLSLVQFKRFMRTLALLAGLSTTPGDCPDAVVALGTFIVPMIVLLGEWMYNGEMHVWMAYSGAVIVCCLMRAVLVLTQAARMSSELPVPENLTMEMVESKERELARRRDAVRKRQNAIPSEVGPENNFPPAFLCVKPQIYHNIKEQIPVSMQRFMYILCTLYISIMIMIVYNIVCALVSLLFHGSAMHFGISFLYLLGIPGAFLVWYYNAYCAMMENKRHRHVLAYLGLFLGVAFDAWMAIGVSGFGGCGWIMTFGRMGTTVVFIMCLISSILWTLHGLILFFMLIHYWRYASRLEVGSRYQHNNV